MAFDATAGTRADELFLVRLDGTASRVVRVSADDGWPSKYPDLAVSRADAALTWFDERDGNQEVYLLVAPMDQLLETIDGGIDPRARRVTNTRGESIGAYVAWNREKIGLAWSDNTAGQHEIQFQLFHSRGDPFQAPRRVMHNPTESLIPAIRPWRDGFALAWNEFRPGRGGSHGADGRSEIVFSYLPD